MTEKIQDIGTRKKKIIVRRFMVAIVFVAAFYLVAKLVLHRATSRAMVQLVMEASKHGAEVSLPSFQSVWPSSFLGATWLGLRAGVQREVEDSKKIGRLWGVQVDRIAVDWDLNGLASLDAHGVTMVGTWPAASEKGLVERRIELEHLSCEFPMELFEPKAAVNSLLINFLQLSEQGEMGLRLEIDGKITFSLNDQPIELRMQTLEQDSNSKVVFLREDVVRLSDLFEDKLTEAEIDLIAFHARRAPRLLGIKSDAELISSAVSQKDKLVPQDAYRHVLWSFMLTQEFGVDFAKQVADAHEMGDTGNTTAEREMDLHNNSVGRRYALEGVSKHEVLERLKADPEVRREP